MMVEARWFSVRSLVVFAALALLLAVVPTTSPANAEQQNEIVLSVSFDGLQPNGDAPFAANTDGVHTPGDDENQNNNVVRTNDIMGYRIDWNVNEVDATEVAITATLPEGMSWVVDQATINGAPTGCVDDGSSTIDGNSGRDLLCFLDAEHEGSNGVIRPQALVGYQYDGTPLELQASIVSDEASLVASNSVMTYASARPKADWIKGEDVKAGDPPVVVAEQPAEEIHNITDPVSGEVGRIWLYPLRLVPVGGDIGAEKMDDSKDIEFYDHGWQMPAGASLARGLVPNTTSGAARSACGAYDGTGPFAVGSPGTWSCSEDAAASAANGYPVWKVTLSGQDTSVLPSFKGDGSVNTTELIVGQIAIFVPESSMASFPVDVYNGISGTTDPVVLPTDLTPIQVWGSAPTSVDEAGTDNNYAYWRATAVPSGGSPGRSFGHAVKYQNGPYREASLETSDGRIYRSVDNRRVTVGGLGRTVFTTENDADTAGWGVGRDGPMSQLAPRGKDLVIHASLDQVQTAPSTGYFFEPSALCINLDTSHQELVPLPATFEVSHLDPTYRPYVWGNAPTLSATQESSNTGPLAQVHIGAHPNYKSYIYSYLHAVETTLIDIPYVVEFAAGLVTPDQRSGINEVTCNNADVDGRGWVDSAGDLSVFDPNGDSRYEDITHVRLRMTGPAAWRGTVPNPRGIETSEAWGTSVNLNLQVRVKDDPLVNEADQELFVYGSRAFTPASTLGSPEGVNVWDPASQADPGTETCTNNTVGLWRDRYGDGVNHNLVIPNGWCNLPFEDDGVSSFDLDDNPYDFGGGGQDAFEMATANNGFAGGSLPRLVHADKVSIVEADTAISKSNLAGLNDVNANGDTAEFEVRARVVGSNLDTLSDLIVTDTLPAEYEFQRFTQLPVTTTNTNATTPPNNDGTALSDPGCSVSGQVITCDFGTQVGGWSDSFRYEVLVKDTGPNQTITNTATISGKDALSGVDKTVKSATAKSFTGDVYDESGIVKIVERHGGPCATYPGPGSAPDDWAQDCSVIVADGNIRFTLDVMNEGFTDLENYRVVDVLPHLGDEVEIASTTLTGDGRSPESAFTGSIEFLAASGNGTTFLYSMDDPNTVSRDPDASEVANTWCDSPAGGTAVFGAGPCPATAGDVTAVYADLGTLAFPETRELTIDMATLNNECGDIYTNSFGARTDDILLPTRSNDVSAMVGLCEVEVDIEKDTNGVQADNVNEDTNGNGLLDDGEDTNDENGVLDVAAPAGSYVGPAIPVGGAVTWTYVVTNGNVALTNATVDDSDPAVTPDCDIDGDGDFDGTNVIPVLLPAAQITCQATGVATEGQYSNDSSVTGTPVVPTAIDPSIDPQDSATWPDDPGFDPSDESTWPLDPAIDLTDPSTWPTDPADYDTPVDPVTGEPMFPASLEDDDPSHYWGTAAEVGVDIEKDTNGDQADEAFGPTVPVGGPVTWTYEVTNTGQLPITPATVTDSDPGLSVVCDASLADAGGDNVIDIFQPGESVTCTATGVASGGNYANTATVSGPTSIPVESCVCDPDDPTSWPTSADALTPHLDPNTGEPVTVEDDDDSHYNGAAPAIDIEKSTNGVQSDESPGEELIAGSTVTWTYEVTNTGTTALVNATVSDDQGIEITCASAGDVANVIPFLLPGEAVTCTGTGPATVGPYTNNSTVSGEPQVPDFATCACDPEDPATWPSEAEAYSQLVNPDGTPADPVTDADPSNYTGVASSEAGIDIEKATNGVQSDEAPGESLAAGSTVTWTYEVSNTGTAALADVTVTDDQGVSVTCAGATSGSSTGESNVIALLLPGETVTCTGTGTAVGGPYMNNGLVAGDPVQPDFGVCDCDPDDSSTWPSDPASFQPATGQDGEPLAPVTDVDPSHYTGTQKISGTVWDDSNSDGLNGADETSQALVLVELLDADGNPFLDADGKAITALTDEHGNYQFDVPPGNYQLRFTAPEGLTLTTPGVLSVAVEAGIDMPNLNAGLNNETPVLAFTGSDSAALMVVGLLALALGLGFTTFGVRRRRSVAD